MLEYIILSYFGLGLFTVFYLGAEAWDVDNSSLQTNFKNNPLATVFALMGLVLVWPIILYAHRNK